MKGYRMTQRDGLEGYCPSCREWYPVPADPTEFLVYWPRTTVDGGMCHACYTETRRAAHRRSVAVHGPRKKPWTPEQAEEQRLYRRANRDRISAYQRVYRLRHREAKLAYCKAYYRAHREKALAAAKANYERRKAQRLAA